ncbi:hypothetical protein M9Y10_014155 [Tritrichomonas musculus]|uniref:Initiator binding domain-containing protein n=1 Tax=Tritrichomonas musculus TaxID=1915356 RepID=A0ABR2KYR1_9EUKA
MNPKTEQSKYSRISGGYNQYRAYEDSTVVIPKRNLLLPSIYEINSDQIFPNDSILEDLIYGGGHSDSISSEADQALPNNHKNLRSENNEKIPYIPVKIEEKCTNTSSNIENLQVVQYNQGFDYSQQTSNDIHSYQYCATTYNANDFQSFNNKGIDPRYYIQSQVPYNPIITQISEDMNSNIIDIQSQSIQSGKVNFMNFKNRIEDNSRVILDPVELKFIPADQWTKGKVSLDHLKKEFFCARSSKCLRFEYKLWNALQITKHYPYLFKEIGVRWIAKSYIMVHRDIFGHLLQVTRPSAALFSSCGMFMTHGFREIMLSEVRNNIDPRDIASIDESIVRLFTHKANDFNEDSSSADIIKIKWNNESRKRAEKW